MIRYISLIIAAFLIIAPSFSEAMEGYEVVASANEGAINLYAKKATDFYRDFKIEFKGGIISRPFWINVTNPTFSPNIIYVDVNQDDKNELIIILTKGYGTGVLQQEAYIFHIDQKKIGKDIVGVPVEVLIDNPMAIVMKNVKTQLTSDKASISIGSVDFTLDIKPLGIKPEHLFNDIFFGNITKFEVTNNQFTATIAGQISPAGGFIGEIVIVYEYRDKMYQAKSIDFKAFE